MSIDPRSRSHRTSSTLGVLVAALSLGFSLPVVAAPALPDWDAAKKKPAPLPDWDTAKKKPEPSKPKPKKPKKPGEPVVEAPPPEPTPEPVPETPPPAEPAPEPVAATPEPEPEPAPAPTPAPAVVEGPAPAPSPSRAADRSREAQRVARGELIAGGVLMGVGVGGLGAMTAGVLLKRSAEDSTAQGAADDLKRAETVLAAGAVSGAIGLLLGLALVVDGARDRKAARAGALADLRVAPSFGGLVLRGRF